MSVAEIEYPETLSLPYQVEVGDEIDFFNLRALCAIEMGLGKTFCALKAVERHPESFPVLVVCPAVVKYNWESEAKRFIGIQAMVCESRTPPEFDPFEPTPKLLIINYDILKDWLPYLEQLGIQMIIYDECQYCINTKNQRTKAAKQISLSVPYILALSGTPMLNILWPETYASSWEFSQQFCGPRYTKWGWDHSGATNLDKLHRDLKRIGMIRRRKSEVLKDLPDKIWRTIPCEMSDPTEYHEANSDFLGWLKKNASHKVKAASKAEQLTRITYLLQLICRLKLRGVVNWANEFLSQSDEKLLLFAVNQGAVDVMKRRIQVESVVVDGNVTGRDREAAIQKFQTDPKTRLFIGTRAAGVGINLTAASEVGIAQLPWKPGDLAQWVDRSHRLCQTKTVFCNFLIALGTLEEKMCRLLHRKAKTANAVLDGGETAADISVFEELLATLETEL